MVKSNQIKVSPHEEAERDILAESQEAITKGEKVRLLWLLLTDQLCGTNAKTFGDIINAMKATQEAHDEGIKYISNMIQLSKTDKGVS